MTDRLKGCTVLFSADIRDDDAERVLDAIRMVKGVSAVSGDIADTQDWMARERVKCELREKLYEVLK